MMQTTREKAEKQRLLGVRAWLTPAASARMGIPHTNSVSFLRINEEYVGGMYAYFGGYLKAYFDMSLDLTGQQVVRFCTEGEQLRQGDVEFFNPEQWRKAVKGMRVRLADRIGERYDVDPADRIAPLVPYRDHTGYEAKLGEHIKILFTNTLTIGGLTGYCPIGPRTLDLIRRGEK